VGLVSASASFRRSASKALSLVLSERARQDQLALKGERFRFTARDLATLDPMWAFAVLTEEVGEVARVLCDTGDTGRDIDKLKEALRPELVQVAAVALAWVEGTLDR
jgi:hypothetical protein